MVYRLMTLMAIAAVVTGASLTVTAQAPRAAAQITPTFTKDVAPIVYAKCASCHRPGEVAPMSLLNYREVRPWASSIRDKVMTRAMPPWHADRQHGKFRNDTSLTQPEIDTIVAWVNGGAREGDPAALPPLPNFPEGWQIGTPDAVFELPVAYDIPARGEIEYQYFEVPTNFTEDRWMQAGEVRAGDRAHVHHIIVYVREPQAVRRPNVMTVRAIPNPQSAVAPAAPAAERPRPATPPAAAPRAAAARPGGGDAMLVNWAVGEDAPVHAQGTAKRIPAGSTLIFQVHYTTNGTPGRDRSRLGLVFAKDAPEREIRTGLIANATFAIPPGASDHQVEAEATFTEDVNLWSMHPHMHLRGKDMTYTAIYPDGRREIVLRVPKYDFNWQTDYVFKEPLKLPKGTTLKTMAWYDNSSANKSNPDPSVDVHWGEQTWEEMQFTALTMTFGQPETRPTGGQ